MGELANAHAERGLILRATPPIPGGSTEVGVNFCAGAPPKLLFVSGRDSPTPGEDDDPRFYGGVLELFSGADSAVASFPLPSEGWTSARGDVRFENPAAPAGISPVRLVFLKEARYAKVKARAVGLALTGPQQSVGIRLGCSQDNRGKLSERPDFRRCPPVGSVSALAGFTLAQDSYTSAKGALISLTRSLAIQFARRNVRCNIIHPGIIATPMQAPYIKDPAKRRSFEEAIPLGRIAHPREIASVALFLASDDSSYVTGTEIVAGGGFMAQ